MNLNYELPAWAEEKLPPEEKYDLSAEDAPHTREK